MSTTKKRINVSLPFETEIVLVRLAERDQIPVATKASDLIRLAIELDEDEVLDKLASERDKKTSKFIAHKDVWK